MSGSGVPWKELAVVGVTTLGVCCAIGWWTGAENLERKKKPQQQGGSPGGDMQEEQEIRTLLAHADQALKKGAFPEVERAYLMLVEITRQSEDPQIQSLTVHMHRRLADLYDRMGNYEKSLKYLELCIDEFTSRDLVQDELSHVLVLAERAVDLSSAHSPQAKHEKFLRVWLDTATKLNSTEYIVMASVLLGRLKFSQEKFVEAEAYLARALKPYTTNLQREELWLSCKTLHVQCLTVLERHEDAKKGFREVADFILNSESNNLKRQLASIASDGTDPSKVAAEMLTNIGDRCLFLGYHEEAEYVMKSNLALLKRKNASVNELATVDNGLAVVWSETGRLEQAREKVKEMKAYLNGSGLFPSYSKFLHTAGVKHEDEGTLVTLYLVKEGANSTRLIKTGSVLVFEFENPEADQPTIQVEYVIKEGEESIKVSAPVKYPSSSQMYSAEVTIYSNDTKSEVIGTHFVFIPTGAAAFAPTTSTTASLTSILEAAAKAAAVTDATSSLLEEAATSSTIASSGSPPAGLEDIVPGTTIRTPNGESIFVPSTDPESINQLEERIIQENALQQLLAQMAMAAKGGDEGVVYQGEDEEGEEGEDEDEEELEEDEEGELLEEDEDEEEEEERLVLNK